MNRRNLLFQSFQMAFVIGSVLALYISLTTFWQMPHGLWLAINNLLVVTSLILVAFVGYKNRALKVPFKFMLLSIAMFFSVIMLLYIGSYFVSTAFFADKMVWIPFFYRDYTFWGFKSVSDYLKHNNNFRELLELQIISLLIGSIMYFIVGSLGYGAKAIIDWVKNSSGTAQSAI